MKKFIALTALAVGSMTQANALTCTGSAWNGPNVTGQPSARGYNYCVANQTSGTTSTQLGILGVDPTKQYTFIGGVSGSALSGFTSTTINYYVGNRVAASQTVSTTSAGNVVQLGYNGVPYFNGIGISQSVPGQISATNAQILTIWESPRIQTFQ